MVLSGLALSELVDALRRRGRDFTDVEVKRASTGIPHLGETLCAFANMPGGGTIILGLEESSGFAAVGVSDPAALEAGVATQARTLDPPIQVRFAEARLEGATLIVVSVAGLPPRDRPCRYAGSAYLRQSDGDYVMSDQEVRQITEQAILAQGGRPRYDAAPVDGTSIRNLDPQLTAGFVAAARAMSRRLSTQSDEDILRLRNVIAIDDERLTMAGLYALGSYPQQYVPSLSITAAVQPDPRSGDRTRDLVHLDGPLPDLLDSAMLWVARNTRTAIRYGEDGHAYDIGEIPMPAVRELIANALVHRDLGPHTLGKRVEIRLKDDTLVINNPGGLWGISAGQLGTPRGKAAVNEYLYDMCKLIQTSTQARVIEGEGGGIREVRTALRHANMPAPQFVDAGVAFTVLVPRSSLIDPPDLEWLGTQDPAGTLTDVQRQIIVSMRHGQRWTNSLVRNEFTPIDSLDARGALQGLVDRGLAVAIGEKGGRAYAISPQFPTVGTIDVLPSIDIVRVDGQPEQDPLPSLEGELVISTSGPGAGEGPFLRALEGRWLTVAELARSTGLSVHQVRYRLGKLKAAGSIDILGGWGVKGTKYRAVSR